MPRGKEQENEDKDKGKRKYTDEQLAEAIRYVVQEVKKVSERVERMEAEPPTKPIESKSKDDDKSESNKSLEEMSRNEFADFIISKVTEGLKPLQEGVQNALRTSKAVGAQAEIERITKDDPDFWKFTDEMKDIQKKYPNASVDELYALARHQNPEKVKELEASKKEEEEEKEKGKEKEEPAFGGFMPTSGKVSEDDSMSAHDAASKAFEELNLDGALASAGSAPHQT